MAEPQYLDLTLDRSLKVADREGDYVGLLHELGSRVEELRAEQQRFREWCDRADLLYYAENFTRGGADLWWDHPDATIPGRAHVSVNTPPAYVDVPSALQAVEPIENMLATDTTEEAKTAAAAMERIYYAWKADEKYDLKFHKACTVKSLYGRTASKIYWDKDEKKPCIEIVEQPRNLWLGYRSDSYEKLEWAAYVTRMEPNAVIEEFGVDVRARAWGGDVNTVIPFVQVDAETANSQRPWLGFGPARIEVWDYWYREPVWGKNGKFVKMETWNVVFAGNQAVRGPTKYPEYDGVIPYVPLFNTFIPGIPDGRAELYDMEPLIREKFERITSGSQMIASGVAGDYWQLVGPEAPTRVPESIKPKRNTVIGPGAGNRIETITPFIAQFQLEQYLARIDREMAVVSGLNDLLLGLAPAQVLSSSKAINALIANYESRLAMRRSLLYAWRKDTWSLVLKVWEKKSEEIRSIVEAGGGTLDVRDPSLNPRDEMETATRALNLTAGKLWSAKRAMDAVHVDDPETEQDDIRQEQTDASLNPSSVMVMAQLLSALQALGIQAPPAAEQQAQGQLASGQEDLRQALGGATPQNTTSSQLAGDQGLTPPIEGAGPNEGGAQPPFAQGPPPGATSQLQSMITNTGEAKGRILSQRQLGRR